MGRRPTGWRLLAFAAAAGLVVAMVPAVASSAARQAKPDRPRPGDERARTAFYDSRQDAGSREALSQRAAEQGADPAKGVKALRDQLGVQGIVSIDPLTGTARAVQRLDGFLTGSSSLAARTVALNYIRSHPDVFGLNADEIARLTLRRDYVDIAGTHHLSFVQSVGGVPVFGNGLQANVAKNGRLINVVGSPVASLPTTAASPSISASQARNRAAADVRAKASQATASAPSGARRSTTFSNGDRADLVYFKTLGGSRLGWQTITSPASGDMYLHIVDAATGRVLYRRDLVQSDSGQVWEYYPGAPAGGAQVQQTLSGLANGSRTLDGNPAHVYSDVNDDDAAQQTEEIKPTKKGQFSYPLQSFNSIGAPCSATFICSWDFNTPNSWQANRAQNGVQVYYYLGKFHDHLAAAPIGFTRAAGNFEAVDGDAIQANSDDGANLANGLPDSLHTDNANMATPPDGIPPRMQMYLFRDPADNTDPFLPSNGGDEADVIYHEFTHGLSNRLVVDALGNSTLGNIQAGSMGEAWSDWYAMDFLNNLGFQPDTAADGEVRIGQYVGLGQDLIRTQPMDCPVKSKSAACHGTAGAGSGGYTYGDFGHIRGVPEVHADGEIWGETLWDLRTALGSNLSESLVTRAMELSAANPSFLDMRNSILQADQVVNNGAANQTIWQVFANRGMGFFAASVNGDDTQPVEDFSLPPGPNAQRGSLTGTVTDDATQAPIAGAIVGFGGHSSGFPGDFSGVTDATGHYTISDIFVGKYDKVFAKSAGFDPVVKTVHITPGTNVVDWQLRRDWAALSGGGTVVAFNGPDFTAFGCGPTGAIDQSLGNGWGSTSDFVNGVETPKFVTVKLPQTINISEIAVDPGNTCGDGGSASTGNFRIETSTDGQTFVTAASGRFGIADRHRLNSVPLNPGTTDNVQFVRFFMLSTQLIEAGGTCPGAFSACDFMDMSEMEVYGAPS
jgi:extracellular elastinolytic metalloproteinase